MIPYLYPISLALFSVLVFALERLFPWRAGQKAFRAALWSDAIHLVFNGHFLGVVLAGLAERYVLPHVDRFLGSQGLMDSVYRNAAVDWPLWAQVLVALFVVDFLQWCVHNLLHRVPALWELHKAHHSVGDGEMDWIVSFRFSWLEVMVYKSVLYLPLVFFGFRWEALMFHAVFGTLIGHLNHANLDLGHGAWRYVLNSPRMHIWHHDYEGGARTTVNFGIIFSLWDWIFGTARMPDQPPARLGFPGIESFPRNFFDQEIWPLQRLFPRVRSEVVWSLVGAGVMVLAFHLKTPATAVLQTPMLAEPAAASQPGGVTPPADAYAGSPAEAEAALAAFGSAARADGRAHPEAMVSVAELARALSASSLVVVDVRPPDRFASGHIPGARQLDRGDYSGGDIPGLSRDAAALQAMLRAHGVKANSQLVLYGDGGPEPYRLWWTLREVAGVASRVLDGGLQAWKQAGHHVAGGDGLKVAAGDVTVRPPGQAPALLWSSARAFMDTHPGAQLLDTRSDLEFTGKEKHPKAAKAGRIPGARHLDWTLVLRNATDDQRMLPQAELRALFASREVGDATPVVSYCQSGTRSAAVYYALYQLGRDPSGLLNYDGSWAEYSRLDLPVEP